MDIKGILTLLFQFLIDVLSLGITYYQRKKQETSNETQKSKNEQ